MARLGHAKEDDWDRNQPAWRKDRSRKEMGLGGLWLEGSTFAEGNEQEMLCKVCNKRLVLAPIFQSLSCQHKKGRLVQYHRTRPLLLRSLIYTMFNLCDKNPAECLSKSFLHPSPPTTPKKQNHVPTFGCQTSGTSLQSCQELAVADEVNESRSVNSKILSASTQNKSK